MMIRVILSLSLSLSPISGQSLWPISFCQIAKFEMNRKKTELNAVLNLNIYEINARKWPNGMEKHTLNFAHIF